MRLILLLLLFLILLPSRIFSETLYDGETLLYGGSVKWDSNGSTLSESTLMPLSPPNHLRASLVNVDYWGAAGYVINRWNPIDFTPYKTLSFAMKTDLGSYAVGVSLFDGDQKASLVIKVDPSKTYDVYTIPISAFEGVSLSKIKVIVFSVSKKDSLTYVVDIDNITLDKESLPPEES
jgi:hypothetical protein